MLDPVGIQLTTDLIATSPGVCYGAGRFLVVYHAQANGFQVYGILLDSSCNVLSRFQITTSLNSGRWPRVSFDGTNFVVVWENPSKGASDVQMARVSPTGQVLDATPINISSRTTAETRPDVTSANGKSLVVWLDARNSATTKTDVYGTIVDSSGAVLNPDGIAVCNAPNPQNSISCCLDSDHFKVVWETNNAEIKGTRVSLGGVVLDPDGWTLCNTGYLRTPRISSSSSGCIVTWEKQADSTATTSEIWGSRINSTGLRLDGNGIQISASNRNVGAPRIAAGQGKFLALWLTQDYPLPYGVDLQAQIISSDGTLLGGCFCPATSAQSQSAPSCASDGRDFLVCWEENRSGESRLFGSIVKDSDTTAPQAVFPIATGPGNYTFPRIAWNGLNYVVVWTAGGFTRFARITPSGSIVDVPDKLISGRVSSTPMVPAVVSDGSRCLVCYQVGDETRAALINREGTIVSDTHIAGSPNTDSGYNVDANVCWTGQCYIVALQEKYYVLDANGAQIGGQRSLPIHSRWPVVACNGRNVLIVYRHDPYSGYVEIRAVRVALDGTLIDNAPRTVYRVDAFAEVSWDGLNYIVSWQYGHSTPAPGSYSEDFLCIRVSADNTVVDTAPIAITNTTWNEASWSGQCTGKPGRTLLTFSGWCGVPYNSMRVKGLFLDDWNQAASLTGVTGLDNGVPARVGGAVVTAAFNTNGKPDYFYAQQGRVSGIRVNSTKSVSVGDSVSIFGGMRNLDGERVFEAWKVDVVSHNNVLPKTLGMASTALGGAPPNAKYQTIPGRRGAYNIGLLARTWSRIVGVDPDRHWFKIDDGGGLGVKCLLTEGEFVNPAWNYVSVTGISSCESVEGEIRPLVRVWRIEDVAPAM